MTMPTIFDVKSQAEEGDYFEPTAADYEGDYYEPCPYCGEPIDYCQGHSAAELEMCVECGLVKESVASPYCDACQAEFDRQFDYGFNVLYYERYES